MEMKPYLSKVQKQSESFNYNEGIYDKAQVVN